jgi:amino acid adenylation domain-containing protein
VSWVVALLGILKAGGAYVPLDSEYPEQRLRFMLEDAGAGLVLTQRKQAQVVIDWNKTEIVYLDDDWKLLARQSQENPETVTSAENLAYVMYTSGSTGQPKGVAVTHLAINRLVSNTNYVKLESDDRIAQVSNASFDAATFEIWGALVHGGQIVGLSKETAVTPAALKQEIRAQQIGVMFLTTALFNQVAQSEPDAFAPLRYLLVGGERFEAKLARRVLAAGKPRHLLNAYGPTENTTFTTSYEVTEVAAEARTIPIGRPIANTEVYVLDQRLQPVPVGVEGELYLSGDGMARSYWQQPTLTVEKFVPNPFSKTPGGRMYRTGDLVRYLSDGMLEFLGRRDSQIKLRGYRIELGEIEAILCRHEQVRDAAVELKQFETGASRLVGYIVWTEDDGEKNIPALRDYLHDHLPGYMVPSAFVSLPELPLNPNGKVDRRALLELIDLAEAERGFVAPRNQEEELVANIWAEVLGVSKVGIEDNFFELGGHSLLATRIVARVSNALQVQIPLDSLFRGGTVAHLVETAQQRKNLNISTPLLRRRRHA